MAMNTTFGGEAAILNAFFKGASIPTAFTLRLFTDAGTLAASDTVATRTAAAGGGYVDKTLALAGATVTTGSGSTPSSVAWAAQTFTFTGALTSGATIKGYLIFDSNNNLIVEEATTNFTPANNGDSYTVTPTIKLGNGTPA